MQLHRFLIKPLVEQALREELAVGDTTGGFLVQDNDPVQSGQIYMKAKGVACGLLLAEETIRTLEPEADVEQLVRDGDAVEPGTSLIKVQAKASTFFAIERCALDWIQQLSGIATKTRRYVDLVKHTKVRLTDTRKGWPGTRLLQKYAVRVGGAYNHIFNLSNCILVKDNHIKIAGGITNVVNIIRARAQHTFKIEVECETLEMVQEALDCGVEVIMFDNMEVDDMKEGLKLVNGRAMVEASGGINESNVAEIAELGVDIISVGDLTHSVRAVDVSMDIQDIKPSALRAIERMGKGS
ncbi:MAG: carboxylating nicotinate-nucleotide diphosphorylase [Gammaproteobacteria bacterium]|nr:carboxylating nicotinate-nucleotide diphosphorylase [Gammaproteobacteria bacterium]NIR82916.1 carboxylating nicotinate-nucleotide diphosphorylase [Gammaproteobacteria bacterium]NIR90185.1 carboxylating nicotinate-nucleotide diphosphorylase [Gammaproteobacteria bacterium]NIU04062.1 carboxylating nicotinate-nucleotide diphosphorylase [Gammaproteobacteria bacterium]NIV51051.1 carboxylating nicotinate-nucleotide diphosphorylase [Gammaproteobacteria bacterium]